MFQNIVLQLGTPINPVISATGTPAQKGDNGKIPEADFSNRHLAANRSANSGGLPL